MFKMAVGQSDDVDPRDAIADAIEQCRVGLGDATPRAAMLFVSYDVFDAVIPRAVREAFPGVMLVGSTAAAEMSSLTGYQEDAVSLVVFASDDVDITAGSGAHADADVQAACNKAVAEALAGTEKRPRLCVIFADALAGQEAVRLVQAALPDDTVLVGGAASGSNLGTPRPNTQFHNDEVIEAGVAMLLFSGPLAFSVAIGTGLRPIGPRGVVTRSGEGEIIEIDGRPATAFIAPYVDVAGPGTFGNPLAIRDKDSADSYLRALIGQDAATGAINIPGSVPVGATVQLTTATADDIIHATSDVIRRANASFPADVSPSGALIFSCAVRKFLLGTRTAQEFSEATSILPSSLPIAGMYCAGEVAPVAAGEDSRFHNQTFVAVLLGS